MISECSLLTETITTTAVSNDVISEPVLLTETATTIENNVITECGLLTETVTVVATDVISEPDLSTETTTAVSEVKSFVQPSDALLNNPDVMPQFSEELADTCSDALEKPVVFTDDGQVSVEGFDSGVRMPETALQNFSLSNEVVLEDINIPITELPARGICHNSFTAELIVQEFKPSYYLCRDAEIYWQEKVARELKQVPFTLLESQEKHEMKHSPEKPLEGKEAVPVTTTEQHKSEAQLDESSRKRHDFEVPVYDMHILLDTERRWHEFKTVALLREQETVSEKAESAVSHAEKEVSESTKEHYVKTQVINPDSPTQSVKETVLPETLTNISKKFAEAEIRGSNSVLDTNRPQVPFCQNTEEVTKVVEEQYIDIPNSTPDLQGSTEFMEDRNTQFSSPETHETQLKPDGIGFSFATKREKAELPFNLYKENVWLESFKFLDAEREWRALHSEVSSKELAFEEDSAGIGTIDVLKSLESARSGDISDGELLQQQQQIEIMDVKFDTSGTLKLESADIPSSQDASQELEMKLVSELPEDSRDISSSLVMPQDQELRAVSCELTKESTDHISQSQDVSQQPKLKSSSELTEDEIQFVLHQDHRADKSNCRYDIVGIHDAVRQHQEQVESELENGFEDKAQLKQKEVKIQGVPEGYCA
ncbi:hypothetical protein B7P43_G00883, partial [Cryptotermes secundus]